MDSNLTMYQPLMEEDDRSEEEIDSPRQRQSYSTDSPKRTSQDTHLDEQILKDVEATTNITSYVYLSASIVAIGGFLSGYDTGVISSAMLLLEQEFIMTALQKGIIVGAVTFGAIFGGATAGYISDLTGRWITSISAALIFLGGAMILSIAHSYSLLVTGRLITGVGVGLASMVVPIYISEISPRFHRGRLVTLNVLFITGGQVIAYLVGIAFVEHGGWRWMFGVSGIPPLIQLLIMPFISESPRFLVKRGRTEEAKLVLRKIYTNSSEEFIEKEIGMIYDTIAEDETGSYRKLIQYPNLRPLIIACGLQAIQQISGFDTAMYYGATIMKMAGINNTRDAIIFSLVVSLTNFLMTGVALYLVDGIGRRKLLLYTLIVTILGLLLLGSGFYFITGFTTKQPNCIDYGNRCGACLLDDRCGFAKRDDGTCLPRKNTSTDIGKFNVLFKRETSTRKKIIVTRQENGNVTDDIEFYDKCPSMKPFYTWSILISLIIYVAAYALGLGHAPWLIQSEIFPLNVRGRATGIATATNWIFNLGITVSFLPLSELITSTVTFWLYALFMIFGWIFIYLLVPETSGLSLETIQELFY